MCNETTTDTDHLVISIQGILAFITNATINIENK
jgi:hypothetical protein